MDAYRLRVEALERAESLLSPSDPTVRSAAFPVTAALCAYDGLLVRLERHAARQRRMDAALSLRERKAAQREEALAAREEKARAAEQRIAEAREECAEIRAALEQRSRDLCVREAATERMAERAEALAELCNRVARLM